MLNKAPAGKILQILTIKLPAIQIADQEITSFLVHEFLNPIPIKDKSPNKDIVIKIICELCLFLAQQHLHIFSVNVAVLNAPQMLSSIYEFKYE
jgi:hypothetical protein